MAPAENLRTTSARVDIAEFFGDGLFGQAHIPNDRPVRMGVVVCSPLHADFRKNYRREVLLARFLSERGFAVQRFHYRGTGNSAGQQATFGTMVEDAHEATRFLFERVGAVPIAYVGTRFGALVAAAAAASVPGAPVVMWEPTESLDSYLREALFADKVRGMSTGSSSGLNRARLREAVASRGSVDIVGYSITKSLVDSAADVNVVDAIGTDVRPVLFTQIDRRDSLRPDFTDIVEKMTSAGIAVETNLVEEEELWWFERGNFETDATVRIRDQLFATTADWLERQLAETPTADLEKKSGTSLQTHDPSDPAHIPFFFEATPYNLFGITTRPTQPNNVGVIILPGSSHYNETSHRNRLSHRLSESLAKEGYTVLRFDYHGVGDSDGAVAEFRIDRPFVSDLDAAYREVTALGCTSVLFVSQCFGARTAMAWAAQNPKAPLAGVILSSPPAQDVVPEEAAARRFAEQVPVSGYLRKAASLRSLKRLADPQVRATYLRLIRAKFGAKGETSDSDLIGRAFIENLGALVKNGVPTMFAYGRDDPMYADFTSGRDGALGPLAELVEIVEVAGILHGFPTVASQDEFIDLSVDWANRTSHGGS